MRSRARSSERVEDLQAVFGRWQSGCGAGNRTAGPASAQSGRVRGRAAQQGRIEAGDVQRLLQLRVKRPRVSAIGFGQAGVALSATFRSFS